MDNLNKSVHFIAANWREEERAKNWISCKNQLAYAEAWVWQGFRWEVAAEEIGNDVFMSGVQEAFNVLRDNLEWTNKYIMNMWNKTAREIYGYWHGFLVNFVDDGDNQCGSTNQHALEKFDNKLNARETNESQRKLRDTCTKQLSFWF